MQSASARCGGRGMQRDLRRRSALVLASGAPSFNSMASAASQRYDARTPSVASILHLGGCVTEKDAWMANGNGASLPRPQVWAPTAPCRLTAVGTGKANGDCPKDPPLDVARRRSNSKMIQEGKGRGAHFSRQSGGRAKAQLGGGFVLPPSRRAYVRGRGPMAMAFPKRRWCEHGPSALPPQGERVEVEVHSEFKLAPFGKTARKAIKSGRIPLTIIGLRKTKHFVCVLATR